MVAAIKLELVAAFVGIRKDFNRYGLLLRLGQQD
jgi:hypothetical protein